MCQGHNLLQNHWLFLVTSCSVPLQRQEVALSVTLSISHRTMNRMSWPKRWPTWKDLWRTLMPSLQHDRPRRDMTPDSVTSLGTQPWNTRNCTEEKKRKKKKGKKKIEENENEGQHMETGTSQHSCYSWSKRDDPSCHRPAVKSLPSWIPVTCWDRAGWDAAGSDPASRLKERKWTWGLFYFWSGFVSVVWLPCLFSVGHWHLCTILFVFLF